MDRMALVICVDVGNRGVKTGIFVNGALSTVLKSFPKGKFVKEAEAIVFSSVSPRREEVFRKSLSKWGYKGKIIRLNAYAQRALKINYDNPAQLGDDRMALAYYLLRRYGGGLGVDAGTFINVEWVRDGVHYPLAIFPGLGNILSLFKRGERLRNLEIKEDFERWGKIRNLGGKGDSLFRNLPRSSEDCINFGIYSAVAGFLNTLINVTGEDKIVFTGGDGEKLRGILGKGLYEPNAVLFGLYEFYEDIELNGHREF